MARKSRMVLNREALHQVDLALAQGMEAWAEEIIERTHAPDQPPIGIGLVEDGGYITYVDGKKVGGTASKKPRGLRVRGQGIVVAVGYGFPARFNEMGTVHQPGRPFFMPVVMAVTGDAGVVIGAMKRALAGALVSQARRLARAKR